MTTQSSETDPSSPRSGYDAAGADDSGFESTGEYPADSATDYVDRVETLIRLLYTLLFFLVIRVVEAAVSVIVVFQLIFALITNRTPNPAVNTFAKRVIEYAYQVATYVTYNRDQPPFPFDELPSDDDVRRDA